MQILLYSSPPPQLAGCVAVNSWAMERHSDLALRNSVVVFHFCLSPCKDNYVLQCAGGRVVATGEIQAVSTSTRPPITTC